MTKLPKVSVLCISYNQKRFIEQCLDSILMQETNFDFEVLVNDDASIDGTKEIIKSYQKKHPDIIKPVFHTENQYSQGRRNMIGRFLLPRAKGQYLAICEGDDFWTDPTKLQQQVDFLEEHKDHALVFHPVRVFFDKGEKEDSVFPDVGTDFTVEELLRWNFIQTNSVMYRARNEYKDMVLDVMPGDWYLHLYHARFGKIGFINRVMSAYRRHDNGVWWGSASVNTGEFLRNIIVGHQRLAREVQKIYSKDKKLVSIAKESIRNLTNETVVLSDYDSNNVEVMMRENPDIMSNVFSENIKEANKVEDKLNRQIESLGLTIAKQQESLAEKDGVILEKTQLIADVTQSKSYKVGRRVTSPYRFAKKAKGRVIKNKNG